VAATHRIELEAFDPDRQGQWVDIHAEQSLARYMRFIGAGINVGVGGAGGQDNALRLAEQVAGSVVAANFPDHELTVEAIMDDERPAEAAGPMIWLRNRIEAHYVSQRAAAQEGKATSAPSSTPRSRKPRGAASRGSRSTS